jgi:hypothetical protein
MSPKVIFRIGIIIIFAMSLYFGYSAKKSYDESLRPVSESFHIDEIEGFRYDEHGHAYKDLDDSETYYLDDPSLYKNTVIGARKDLTLPKPLTIEDLRKKRKDQPIDEFQIKGKTTKDRDAGGSAYMDEEGAYGGSLPDRY